jgi:hypothetical protein
MQSMHGKICSQYCIGAGSMPSWVQYLFMWRLEDLLSLSVHYQIKWLEAVQKAWKMQQVHKAQQTSTLTRSREIMANWLAGHVCYRPKNAS